MSKKAAVVTTDLRPSLAKEFVSLVWDRLIGDFATGLQVQVESLQNMVKGEKDVYFAKEIKEKKERLRKTLSTEVQQKVFDKLVCQLAEALTEEELRYAIFQEKITIKIHGVASQLEAAFEEAVGEA
ncbi:hypothetical protein KP12_197 [Klebsiella phage KP12]|jgi:hypothetical protein|uniref:Uncharacterized protein n=2 Tax=Caudoviricetes TaxID=2731619 RepID=A0A9E6Z540_9CAUD|nr:hypothetical protein VIK251_00162 [Klebsiella phage vB_KpnM_VIK251]UNI73605.1 hypothetical protein KP12_197 [Klebsiella phage KP12]UVX29442.1 hypothetical protein M5b_00190 [Klebsiella phage VLCpiM5b]